MTEYYCKIEGLGLIRIFITRNKITKSFTVAATACIDDFDFLLKCIDHMEGVLFL